MNKLAVIGAGYVGLVTGICLASCGHDVTCMDIDECKIDQLKAGRLPLFEPGLQELHDTNTATGRLSFTTNPEKAVQHAEGVFIAVGTPPRKDGGADLSYIHNAIQSIAPFLQKDSVIIMKSTVPVGTHADVKKLLDRTAGHPVRLVSNPEFLREGSAVNDFFYSDRIVIGSNDPSPASFVEQLYHSIPSPVIHTDPQTAEMIKYSSNAFLAAKISFINEMAALCEAEGADISMVAAGMGMDKRIGEHFLKAGIGYGGSCFPKDTTALLYSAAQQNITVPLLSSIHEVNRRQPRVFIKKVLDRFGSIEGKKAAVLGLTFKPNTDDLRRSPSREIINLLVEEGAMVTGYDPVVSVSGKRVWQIPLAQTMEEALTGADLAVICTEWKEIIDFPLHCYPLYMKEANIFDGRNCYPVSQARGLPLFYSSVGRPVYKGI
ncbi:nucleotide sugar dehydrogenase [Halobacillus litoralis]|uniref:UDP-glucose 6-dehydrogenase n=1 Tax=Halobacillus litoralis TaxID=45668 RepID=A0A845DPF9_9BACI|nr:MULTISPECIES: UDP-glucose/GDP-mannose dehydrogenase family protein [Halobacillus]MYL19501.1 nucleotide sugar dehydrogenase [Halobacillus litoralis]MYL28647.1 nucleotide sugar dehydrogenase [Halobacillus halophilus]